jgi:4-hydroxybenzoate polyprenyltransferase
MTDISQNTVADALPDSWVYRLLPEKIWPFAQMGRWERPIGWRLLMWPCWWSLMMAVATPYVELTERLVTPQFGNPLTVSIWHVLHLMAIFLIGAFAMRGAGCTYNDLVDEDIDAKVARTRSRPLPSGRITKKQALVFLILQLLVGLGVLLQFNWYAIGVGFASVITILVYPFMKRITYWPQIFLGLAFSWGAFMGWWGIYGYAPQVYSILWVPPLLIYFGCMAWVIGYDTIYAHQDIEDDVLAGVKSTARLFQERTKPMLVGFYSTAIVLFGAAFYYLGLTWPAWIGLAAGAGHMIWQLTTLNIKDPANCLARFKSNSHFGWLIFTGLAATALLNL